MITFLTFLFTTILLLTTSEWVTSLLTPNNLAEIGVVILGIIAVSASVQIRTLFEKCQEILRLYARYTNPTSEEGKKLSQQEKERLLDLFLHELRMVIEQFGGKIVIRIGGFIRKVFDKLFGYKA